MDPGPPHTNLLVIRSPNIDRAVTFYEKMGLVFERHSHGTGPQHYASEANGFVFEIYPQRNTEDATTNVRLGFRVDDVDHILKLLHQLNVTIVREAVDTEWGRRAVVKDLDGHTVELLTSSTTSSAG